MFISIDAHAELLPPPSVFGSRLASSALGRLDRVGGGVAGIVIVGHPATSSATLTPIRTMPAPIQIKKPVMWRFARRGSRAAIWLAVAGSSDRAAAVAAVGALASLAHAALQQMIFLWLLARKIR